MPARIVLRRTIPPSPSVRRFALARAHYCYRRD